MFENFPYTNFHDLNLDWIIERIMSAYGPDNPPPVGLVLSVNGETGAVVTYKNHIVQLPDVPENLWNIFRLIDNQANGIQFTKDGAAERIQGSNRYKIYDEGNPPPVSSVDGMTGAVNTWAYTSAPNVMVPQKSLLNSWGIFRTLNNNSLIGITLKYDSVLDTYKAFLAYAPVNGTMTETELLTSASLPPSGVVSVNGQTGIVTLDGEDIAISTGAVQSIKDVTDALATAISGKLAAPAQAGSQGQVLGLDQNLQPVWMTVEGSGTTDYTQLTNKPQINSVTLEGNKTLTQLGIQPAPAAAGSQGQVLGLDANLLPVWLNQQSGQLLEPQMGDIVFSNEVTSGSGGNQNNFYIKYGKLLVLNFVCQNVADWASGTTINICTLPDRLLGYGNNKIYQGPALIQTGSPAALYPTTYGVLTGSGEVRVGNVTGSTIPASSIIFAQITLFLA